MFPMIICLIFSTFVLCQADDYNDTYTFSELKSYLNSFEDTLKEGLKNDLTAFEKRMGTLKSFIDSTLLHQVNHLQKGLSSVKAHLRVNTAEVNKLKAKEESLENYFLSSVKDLKASVNVTRHHQMSEQCRDCQKSIMDSEIRLKKAMKAEAANLRDDLHTTTESLRNVTFEMEGVKENLSELGRLTTKLVKYHNITDIALVDKPAGLGISGAHGHVEEDTKSQNLLWHHLLRLQQQVTKITGEQKSTKDELLAIKKVINKLIPRKDVCDDSLTAHIPDSSFTASSLWSEERSRAYQGRLNTKVESFRIGTWAAETNNKNQWLQVDLGNLAVIHTVTTQGRNEKSKPSYGYQWVTEYAVDYSLDRSIWTPVVTSAGARKIFNGNTDADTTVTNSLGYKIIARYVRIKPQAWHGYISMRMDVNGCFIASC